MSAIHDGFDLSIGVVVPAYKSEATIGDTLDAIAAQTLPADAVIVVVDGPDPETESVVRSHSSGVELLVLPSNTGGPATPRNQGLLKLLERRGLDAAWFLDADDLPDPRFLSAMSRTMGRYPDVDLVGTRFSRWRPGDEPPSGDPRDPSNADAVSIDLDWYLAHTGALLPSFTLVRVRALSTLRDSGLPYEPDLPNNQDYEMFIRMLNQRPGVLLDWSGGNYRLHPDGISASGAKAWLCRMAADQTLHDWFEGSGCETRAAQFDSASSSALRTAARHLWRRNLSGDRGFAIRLLADDIVERRSVRSLLLLALLPVGFDAKTRRIPTAGDSRSAGPPRG